MAPALLCSFPHDARARAAPATFRTNILRSSNFPILVCACARPSSLIRVAQSLHHSITESLHFLLVHVFVAPVFPLLPLLVLLPVHVPVLVVSLLLGPLHLEQFLHLHADHDLKLGLALGVLLGQIHHAHHVVRDGHHPPLDVQHDVQRVAIDQFPLEQTIRFPRISSLHVHVASAILVEFALRLHHPGIEIRAGEYQLVTVQNVESSVDVRVGQRVEDRAGHPGQAGGVLVRDPVAPHGGIVNVAIDALILHDGIELFEQIGPEFVQALRRHVPRVRVVHAERPVQFFGRHIPDVAVPFHQYLDVIVRVLLVAVVVHLAGVVQISRREEAGELEHALAFPPALQAFHPLLLMREHRLAPGILGRLGEELARLLVVLGSPSGAGVVVIVVVLVGPLGSDPHVFLPVKRPLRKSGGIVGIVRSVRPYVRPGAGGIDLDFRAMILPVQIQFVDRHRAQIVVQGHDREGEVPRDGLDVRTGPTGRLFDDEFGLHAPLGVDGRLASSGVAPAPRLMRHGMFRGIVRRHGLELFDVDQVGDEGGLFGSGSILVDYLGRRGGRHRRGRSSSYSSDFGGCRGRRGRRRRFACLGRLLRFGALLGPLLRLVAVVAAAPPRGHVQGRRRRPIGHDRSAPAAPKGARRARARGERFDVGGARQDGGGGGGGGD
mmetsp:Transcript_18996/g.55136  ORF Transcript_18996/g.55136 Transcript_18996/m.55136 type:complete len:663 (-) Transcript_18996:43-2031(-)